MFIPTGDNINQRTFPLIPCVLIGLNVLVFAYQTRLLIEHEGAAESQIEFLECWGLIPEQLAGGQVLGMMTHMFVHAGVVHLVGNMLVLWAFAASLEVGLGSLTLLGCYMMWGLVAGVAHAAMNWQSDIPMVGASGAIAGLIGAYTVAYGADAKIRGRFFLGFHSIPVEIPAALFGMMWIGFQLWDAAGDVEGMAGVAWYAHIGGFFAGALTIWLGGKALMEQVLVTSKDGQPIFVEKPAETMETGPVAGTYAPEEVDPSLCPYCRTALTEATQLAAGLLRCGNGQCERLVYSSEVGVC